MKTIILGIFIIFLAIIKFSMNFDKRLYRILPYFKKTDKILDFGCGTCCHTKKLKELGYNVVGLDIEDKSKCLSPELYDGKTIEYPDNHFDIIICSFVLHHIKYPEETLKELRRVGKKIIIYEDIPESEIDYYFTNKHGESHWGNGKFYNTKQWIDIFRKNGFDIKYVEDISRYEFPFSDKPWFYPIKKSLFIIEKDLGGSTDFRFSTNSF
jgi:SAM-dependent methyltransferase